MRLCICQIIFGKNLHNSVVKQKNSDYPWRQLAKMRFNMVIWTHKSFFCHSHVKTTGVKGHRAYAQPQIGSQLLKQGTLPGAPQTSWEWTIDNGNPFFSLTQISKNAHCRRSPSKDPLVLLQVNLLLVQIHHLDCSCQIPGRVSDTGYSSEYDSCIALRCDLKQRPPALPSPLNCSLCRPFGSHIPSYPLLFIFYLIPDPNRSVGRYTTYTVLF